MNERQKRIWEIVLALAGMPGAEGVRINWSVDGVEDFESFKLYEIPENTTIFPDAAKDFLIIMKGDTLAAADFNLRSEFSRVLKEHGISEIPEANFRIPQDENESESYTVIIRV